MRSAVVVGTGLIGTSVALALNAQGVRVHLRDVDPAAARIAASRGAGVVEPQDGPVDLAVMAVPPHWSAACWPTCRRTTWQSITRTLRA